MTVLIPYEYTHPNRSLSTQTPKIVALIGRLTGTGGMACPNRGLQRTSFAASALRFLLPPCLLDRVVRATRVALFHARVKHRRIGKTRERCWTFDFTNATYSTVVVVLRRSASACIAFRSFVGFWIILVAITRQGTLLPRAHTFFKNRWS